MCFTCSAKVRTPLKSPFVGAKEYLSSGIASAAETTSCSTIPNCMLRTDAMVGGCCCAVEPPWAREAGAKAIMQKTARTTTRRFINFSLWIVVLDYARKSYAFGAGESLGSLLFLY